mgnify:CR=1 FL=1
MARPRPRDLGIIFGEFEPGKGNAITDVVTFGRIAGQEMVKE